MEVMNMPYRAQFGMGRGFGFGGYSLPWPYVGRGRGGLPRCWAYPSGAVNPDYEMMYPYQGGFGALAMPPFNPRVSPDQELAFLKNQAEMLRQHLDQIVARVEELENSGGSS
jgi:hypothetical protein